MQPDYTSIESAINAAYVPNAQNDQKHDIICYAADRKVFLNRLPGTNIPPGYERLTLRQIVDLVTPRLNDAAADKKALQACHRHLKTMGEHKVQNTGYGLTLCGALRELLSKLQNLILGYGFCTSAELAATLAAKLALFNSQALVVPPPAASASAQNALAEVRRDAPPPANRNDAPSDSAAQQSNLSDAAAAAVSAEPKPAVALAQSEPPKPDASAAAPAPEAAAPAPEPSPSASASAQPNSKLNLLRNKQREPSAAPAAKSTTPPFIEKLTPMKKEELPTFVEHALHGRSLQWSTELKQHFTDMLADFQMWSGTCGLLHVDESMSDDKYGTLQRMASQKFRFTLKYSVSENDSTSCTVAGKKFPCKPDQMAIMLSNFLTYQGINTIRTVET